MLERSDKIVITGAAGLVGQNLIHQLLAAGYDNIVAMDKHAGNLAVLQQLHPGVTAVEADLSSEGDWSDAFEGGRCLIQLQAQITGKDWEIFERNTIASTRHVLEAAGKWEIPFIVHVSSSVVISVADDHYTRSKIIQEKMVVESGLPCCILRPTLMFGWFDPKHLGWLSKFMERVPVFPIPGNGKYMRQPLYEMDFCRVLIHCAINQPAGRVYDIVGHERVDYIDIIRTIKRVKQLRTLILCIPYWLFWVLLKIYALFSARPPFTADQLKALTAGDEFTGVDIRQEFGIEPTPFRKAIEETFTHPRYSKIVLDISH